MAKTTPFKQSDNFKDSGSDEVCVRCGKPLREVAGYIHLINGGADILNPTVEGDPDDGGEMGWHPVGSECAKYYKGFISPGAGTINTSS